MNEKKNNNLPLKSHDHPEMPINNYVYNILNASHKFKKIIFTEHDKISLAERSCQILSDIKNFNSIWIILFAPGSEDIEFIAESGFKSGSERVKNLAEKGIYPGCIKKALSPDKTLVIKDPHLSCNDCPMSGYYKGQSRLLSKLESGDKVFGILSVSVYPDYFENNEAVSLFSEFSDDLAYAFSRIEKDELLEEYRWQLQRAQSVADIGSWTLDPATGKVEASEQARKIYGLFETHLNASHIQPIPLPEYRDKLDQAMKDLIEHNIPYNVEFKIRRLTDRKIRFIHSAAEYDRIKNKIVGTIQDITDKKETENKLKESENKFRSMAENFSDFLFMTDLDGKITYASPSSMNIFGYTPSEMTDTHFSSYLSKEYLKIAEDEFREVLQMQRKASDFFLKIRKKDSSFFMGELTGSVLKVNGIIIGTLGIIRDVTEKREFEEKLVYSEERYKLLSDVTTEGILIHRNGIAIDVNSRLCELLGFERDELLNHDMTGLVHPDYMDIVRENIVKEKCSPYTIKMFKKNGDYFYAEIESRNIRTTAGVSRATAVRDVTDRQLTEEKLMRSEDNFRLLIENLPDEVFVHDLEGNIIFANRIASINTGYSKEELALLTVYDLDPESEEREDKVKYWKKISYNEIHQFPSNHLRKDSSVYPVEVLLSKMNRGKDDFIIAVVRDLTENQEYERERTELRNQLEQSRKLESVGRLAGGVAHDFNNMLSIIIGNSDLILRSLDKTDSLYRKIEKISQAAERSADLTRQLLAFARQQTIRPEILDINETIGAMLRMVRRLIGEDITLRWEPGKNVGKVCADPSQIDQIIINLVINARDAIGHKSGRIIIGTESIYFDREYCKRNTEYTEGEYVRINISDDGCGIEKEDCKKIFEPFFTTKSKDRGTGLGLSTVYGIVRQNNGYINVYSEPGTGTTFKIYLPVSKNVIHPETAAAEKSGPKKGHETILVVEDEKEILEMIKESLEDAGYSIISCSSPVEALNKAREYSGNIDLLLTDVIMPEMNGRELSKSLMSLYPGIRRLFMSGYTADIIAHQGILESEINFIQKPFAIDRLFRQIREILDKDM